METIDVLKKLNSLFKLDIDAYHTYQQAMENEDLNAMQHQILECRDEHLKHIEELKSLILKYGGDIPKFEPTYSGFHIQGFTNVKEVKNLDKILNAMKRNELLTNSTYDNVLAMDVPLEIREMVIKNREEERRHLRFIEYAIKNGSFNFEEKVA